MRLAPRPMCALSVSFSGQNLSPPPSYTLGDSRSYWLPRSIRTRIPGPPMATTRSPPRIRKRILIRGVVQGVGFRPFVYNLAQSLRLTGFILNSSSGVTVEIEGADSAVDRFLNTLRTSPPPLAQIMEIALKDIPLQNASEFSIRPSVARRELSSPSSLQTWQPVTIAGRSSAIRPTAATAIPLPTAPTAAHDTRSFRTLLTIVPTPRCRRFICAIFATAEYEDPNDRRFHAEPNACPACGPTLMLTENRRFGAGSQPPQSKFFCNDGNSSLGTLQRVRDLLHAGRLVAMKGLGGFLLACDAQNDGLSTASPSQAPQ